MDQISVQRVRDMFDRVTEDLEADDQPTLASRFRDE
jgi:hypothetical protein